MDNKLVGTVAAAFACNAVIKAAANSQNQVGLLNGIIGTFMSMQACHSQKQLSVGTNRTKPHQRADNRNMQFFTQMHSIIFGIGIDNATADQHYRALCLVDSRCGRCHTLSIMLQRLQLRQPGFLKIYQCRLHITRHIYQHRPRTSLARQLEGKAQCLRQVFRLFN